MCREDAGHSSYGVVTSCVLSQPGADLPPLPSPPTTNHSRCAHQQRTSHQCRRCGMSLDYDIASIETPMLGGGLWLKRVKETVITIEHYWVTVVVVRGKRDGRTFSSHPHHGPPKSWLKDAPRTQSSIVYYYYYLQSLLSTAVYYCVLLLTITRIANSMIRRHLRRLLQLTTAATTAATATSTEHYYNDSFYPFTRIRFLD